MRKIRNTKETERKEQFETAYKESQKLPRQERKAYMRKAMEETIPDKEQRKEYVERKQQNQIKREQVVEFLKHTVWQKPQLMIYTLIQKIVLYDDRIDIFYNYIDPIKPDSSSDGNNHRLFFIWDSSNILQPVLPSK